MHLRERFWDLVLGPDPVIRAEAKVIEAVAEQVREETRRAKEKEAAEKAKAGVRKLAFIFRQNNITIIDGAKVPTRTTFWFEEDAGGGRYWKPVDLLRVDADSRHLSFSGGAEVEHVRGTPAYMHFIRPWLDGTLSTEQIREMNPVGVQFPGEAEAEADPGK